MSRTKKKRLKPSKMTKHYVEQAKQLRTQTYFLRAVVAALLAKTTNSGLCILSLHDFGLIKDTQLALIERENGDLECRLTVPKDEEEEAA